MRADDHSVAHLVNADALQMDDVPLSAKPDDPVQIESPTEIDVAEKHRKPLIQRPHSLHDRTAYEQKGALRLLYGAGMIMGKIGHAPTVKKGAAGKKPRQTKDFEQNVPLDRKAPAGRLDFAVRVTQLRRNGDDFAARKQSRQSRENRCDEFDVGIEQEYPSAAAKDKPLVDGPRVAEILRVEQNRQ